MILKEVLWIVVAYWMVGCSSSPVYQSPPIADSEKWAAPRALYLQHCSQCHGSDRLGGSGPALIPESFARINREEIKKVILEGRPMTQMAGFSQYLNEEQVSQIVDYLHQKPAGPIVWGMEEIKKSHEFSNPTGSKPVFKSDRFNVFMVVESGFVSVLDGDQFKVLTRFPTRFALHGGIKFSPDGRYAYLASRDGWISTFDIYQLKIVSEIRVGINTRNLAVSHDGTMVVAANYLPHSLVFLEAPLLKPIEVLEARSLKGETSRVSAVYASPPRASFIIALKDISEVWEIPYKRPLAIRRMSLAQPLDDFFFDSSYRHLVGASREGKGWVFDLDRGETIKELGLTGMPHLGSGIEWTYAKGTVLATPNLQKNNISIIDTRRWEIIKQIETGGPGFFLRSHDQSPYAWAGIFSGPNKDQMQIIDKKTLEIVRKLKPRPGKTAGHVEFSRDGRYALVSIWEDEGELLIYDTKTFEIKKALPMRKPSGKYNVFNKITYARGTSH